MKRPNHEEFSRRLYYTHLAFGVLLLVCVAWVTGWLLPIGWSADDGAHIRFSSVYALSHYLLDPELLWVASYANLTPLLNVYYSLNLALFGLDDAAWRLVLSSLAVLSVMACYLGARALMSAWVALFVAAAWAAGVPFFYTAATHMTSHYLLGMVGAGLCVWSFARWVKQGKLVHLLLALFFYAMAVLAKEVYAPLPALFFLMRPWGRTIKGLIGLGLVALLYLALRKLVLGSVVGGYRSGQYVEGMDWHSLAGALPNVAALMFGGYQQALAWGAVLLVLIWRALGERLELLAAATLVAVVAFIPLMPLMAASPLSQPDRYLFFASALFIGLVGLAMERVWQARALPLWVLCIAAGLLLAMQVRTLASTAPPLANAFNFQVQVYRHALQVPGPMLIINAQLPADLSYWSQVLNAIREAQARLAGKDNYDRVMLVSDQQAPLQFALERLGIPIYKYDAACNCIVSHKPSGEPTRTAVDMAAQRVALVHLKDPARRPENNQSSLGSSIQTVRSIALDDPKVLELAGSINLGMELDWLYIVLSNRELPRVISTGLTPVTGPTLEPKRAFHIRLQFNTPELAKEALQNLCISVPAVLKTHYSLLQGQPEYCNIFVNVQLRKPQ
jgi:hypothetical protein